MAGILVTCARNQEARCTSEFCQILESVLETEEARPLSESGDAPPVSNWTTGDFSADIAREVAELRNPSTKDYQALRTGEVNCMVFIKLGKNRGDPSQIVQKIFQPGDNGQPRSARFCQRIIPLSRVFRANLEDLRREVASLLGETICAEGFPRSTYSVAYESRMSDCLDRRIVIDLVADLVGTRHTVQLEGPAWTIMIQTFKSICGASVLPDYARLRKYNIQEYYKASCGPRPSPSSEPPK